MIEESGIKTKLIDPDEPVLRLPSRPAAGHKGTFGHVIAIGGSEGMTGAIYLAATAALRSGAGLVTALVPRSLHTLMEIKTVEVMTKPLPETEAISIGQEALDTILDFAHKGSVVLAGPGMSQHVSTAALLMNLLPKLDKPLVLDADALNIISNNDPEKVFTDIKAPIVITPHPGEMARLMGVTVQEVQQNRLEVASLAAQEWEVIVILKGAKTIVAHPGGEIFVNPTGNPGMATGGSGECVGGYGSGLDGPRVGGLGCSADECLCTWTGRGPGCARKGQIGLIAGDLLEQLPNVFFALEKGNYPTLPRINERLKRIL